MAIDVGFRHFDAAYIYQNEKEVGKAIREKIADGTVKREDIFYTTKVLWASDEKSLLDTLSCKTQKTMFGLGLNNLCTFSHCRDAL